MNPFSPHQTTTPEPPARRQVVTFQTAGTIYGLEIEAVQELLAFDGFTPLPQSPPYSPGTFDLRGRVVPAVDLRLRLGLESREYNRYTVIVVIRSAQGMFGLVVDQVSDVIGLAPDKFQPAPGDAFGDTHGHIASVAHCEAGLVYLLDPDRLTGTDLKTSAEDSRP